MNQFICYAKCTTCQKARRWLEAQGIAYTERPIKEQNPSAEELRDWQARSGLPLRRFFNTSGMQYRALNLSARLPEMTEEALARLIEDRVSGFSGRTCSQLLLGLLPRKLYEALLKNSGVRLQQDIGEYFIDKKDRLDKKRIAAVVHMLKHLRVQAEGTMGWDHAQVTSGGVDVSEIDAAAMESKLVPGLYITGELMDVDGPCGGYNLHWAWATGILAGRSAATKCG